MATLSEVARVAGVSKAAASSVLGAKPSTTVVSPPTRQRILDAARRLNYRRNPLAASLRTRRTHNIVLLMRDPIPFLTHPNGAASFAAIIEAAAARGYRVSVQRFDPAASIDPRLMDGCVVFGALLGAHRRTVAQLAAEIPVLMHAPAVPGAIALARAGRGKWYLERRRAAEYLYDLGHRHIAVTDLETSPPAFQAAGFFHAVAEERGLEVTLQCFKDNWQKRTYQSIEAICRLDPLPTAVFAFDDDYARALIARLARRRLCVPEDVSVFSGETHRDGFQSAPPLTGLELNLDAYYAQVFRAFIDVIEHASNAKEIVVDTFQVQLIERESCGAVRPTSIG